MEQQINCRGYILAGGKSSRMGEDKGLMLFKGKPVVQYVIDALAPAVDEVVIVSNNSAYNTFGLQVIGDEIRNVGPAGGISAVLEHSTVENNFIVACDMPFATEEAIRVMLHYSKGFQITLPQHGGQLEPLFGVYATSCKDEWLRLVRSGEVKLHELVKHFSFNAVNVDQDAWFNEKLFMNINTRQEFDAVLKQE